MKMRLERTLGEGRTMAARKFMEVMAQADR